MARATKERATIICQEDGKVLLVRKADDKWNLPGGKVESGEKPLQAAVRELSEETGLETDSLQFLGRNMFEQRAHYVFLAAFSSPVNVVAQNEIAECRWFSRAELETSPLKRTLRKLLQQYG